MNNEEKNDNDWKPLQVIKKDFDLVNYVDSNLLDCLKESFDVDEAIPLNLTIFVKNKEDKKGEIISFNHQTPEDMTNKDVLIDLNERDSFEKVKKAVEKVIISKDD